MMQTGLFDWQQRFEELDKGGDPLVTLNAVMDWEAFRPALETLREKERKSNAGRKPFDVLVLFKILILPSRYNLSDDQSEFQIRDRLSFMRFLGLHLGARVPDAKTIWLFRDQLTQANLVRTLFDPLPLPDHSPPQPCHREADPRNLGAGLRAGEQPHAGSGGPLQAR